MIKIRALRETTDETVNPTSRTTEYLWIGCIASELTRCFPVQDANGHDTLQNSMSADGKQRSIVRFEGFSMGIWYRISDPRTHTVPATEEALDEQFRLHSCPDCMTVDLNDEHTDAFCSHCDERYYCLNCGTPSRFMELSDGGYCDLCEEMVECADCCTRHPDSDLVNQRCRACHDMHEYDIKLEQAFKQGG